MIKIYEISPSKLAQVKNLLEAPDTAGEELDIELEKEPGKGSEKAKAWKINEFKKQGYLLREAKALGIDKKCSYLYIEAGSDFFEKHEKSLIDAGANEVARDDFEEIKQKIEKAEHKASEGIGFLFK
jgi:hypothetical protein